MDPRVEALRPVIQSFGLSLPTVEAVRAAWTKASAKLPPPEGVSIDRNDLAHMPALFIRPTDTRPSRRILYFHSGAYVFGGIETQKGLSSRLARATGLEVVQPEYRVAPEHPCPAAIHDAVAGYRELLDQEIPVAALAGGSAGGGLALLAAIAIRDAGLPLPPAVVAFSPWTDLALSGQRVAAGYDDMVVPLSLIKLGRDAWLNGKSGSDPAASPLYADLRGIPPTMIQVGGDEILLDDSTRIVPRLADAGVEISLTVRPGMIHLYPSHPALAPESDDALAEVDAFLKRH